MISCSHSKFDDLLRIKLSAFGWNLTLEVSQCDTTQATWSQIKNTRSSHVLRSSLLHARCLYVSTRPRSSSCAWMQTESIDGKHSLRFRTATACKKTSWLRQQFDYSIHIDGCQSVWVSATKWDAMPLQTVIVIRCSCINVANGSVELYSIRLTVFSRPASSDLMSTVCHYMNFQQGTHLRGGTLAVSVDDFVAFLRMCTFWWPTERSKPRSRSRLFGFQHFCDSHWLQLLRQIAVY